MIYFLMLLSVFIIAYVIAGYLLRNAKMPGTAILGWMLAFAGSATFLFHNLH